jgi:hypothetical protein
MATPAPVADYMIDLPALSPRDIVMAQHSRLLQNPGSQGLLPRGEQNCAVNTESGVCFHGLRGDDKKLATLIGDLKRSSTRAAPLRL